MRLPSRPATLLAAIRRAWRRSLQLRVVTLTLVMSTALVATFGLVVATMIVNGLLTAKTNDARKQVAAGTESLRDFMKDVRDINVDPYPAEKLPEFVSSLTRGNQDSGFSVAVAPKDPTPRLAVQAQPDTSLYEQLQRQQPELMRAVSAKGFFEQRVMLNPGSGERLYLVFGRSVTARTYQLDVYYFFPL